jgi:aspartate/methionine/tyrosine aminotransferase
MFSQRTSWRLNRNALTQALDEIRASGQSVLDLTISNPTEAGISPDHEKVLAALSTSKAMTYDPQPRGSLTARQAVNLYYRESHGIDLDLDRLLLTTSTSEGYAHVFRLLCNVGDEVLVPKPSYPLFEFLADLADVKLVPYPLFYDHGWQIDLESLRQSATSRTRAVILVHPNNPTGSHVSTAESSALNAFCRDHEMALIVDEVFLDYSHDETSRRSFAANTDALTFTLSGVSKISAMPQMKFAWVASSGPKALVHDAIARLEIISDTFLSMNTPVQLAASELLAQRKQIQPIVGDRLRSNLAELDRQLVRNPSCSRLQVEGGWYVILRVPAIQSDEEMAIRLVREGGVNVHPGHFYDFPQEGYLVLSLLTAPSIFSTGVSRLLPLVR